MWGEILLNYKETAVSNGYIEIVYVEQQEARQKNELNNKYRLLDTKLLTPSITDGVVFRNRLFEKLDESLRKKLTIVQAPAGFGKTTLVNSWISARKDRIQAAWLSVDTEDSDIRQFWYYVISAAEKKNKGCFHQPLNMLQSVQPYPIDSVLKAFINILFSIPNEMVLVIDDYHAITSGEIQTSMEYFLKHLPQNFHVILTTRMMPSFAMSRMRVNDEMTVLKSEDLRFTGNEIGDFINGKLSLNLTNKEIAQLENKTEGWIAALKIAAFSMRECANRQQFLLDFDCSKQELLEYLSEEIINQFSEEIREFLYRTCILDVLSSSICQALTGEKASHQILEMLSKNNLFTFALDENGEHYKYHDMMAGFLRDKMSKCCPGLEKELYVKASEWYEANENLPEALDYSVRSEYHANTARLIEKYAEQILMSEDYVRFISFVEKLPAEVLLDYPLVCIYYAFSFARLGLVDKEESILHGKGISLDHERFKEFAFEVALVRSTAARCRADIDIEAVIDFAKAALKQEKPVNLLHVLVNGNLGNAYAMKGELRRAEYYFKQALQISKKYGGPYLTFRCIHFLAQIQVNFGQLHSAMEVYNNAVLLLNAELELIAPAANVIYLGMGNIYYELNQIEQAHHYIQKCIDLSELRKDSIRLVQGYIALIKILQVRGKYGEVFEYLSHIEEICTNVRAKFVMLQHFSEISRVLMLMGQRELAKGLMRKYEVGIHEEKSFLYEDEHIAVSDYCIAAGDYREADGLLNVMLPDARSNDRTFSIIKILALKALSAKETGCASDACMYLHEAVCLGLRGGFIRLFIDYGMSMKELLLTLVDYERCREGFSTAVVSYILKLLSHFDNCGSAAVKEENFIKGFRNKEVEVLKYLMSGYSNQEIADTLYLSVSSVKKYVNSIFEKLNVNTRTQAIAMARRFYIVDAEKVDAG